MRAQPFCWNLVEHDRFLAFLGYLRYSPSYKLMHASKDLKSMGKCEHNWSRAYGQARARIVAL